MVDAGRNIGQTGPDGQTGQDGTESKRVGELLFRSAHMLALARELNESEAGDGGD